MSATATNLIAAQLKARPMTYMEMLRLGLSTSPWKRVAEWLEFHPHWRLMKGVRCVGRKTLVTWRLVRA